MHRFAIALLLLSSIHGAAFQSQSAVRLKTANPKPAMVMPVQEVQLCQLFDEFDHWQPPRQDSNPIKQATAPPIKEPDWQKRMNEIMGDGSFTDWKAKLHYLGVVNGEVDVIIDIPCAQFVAVPAGRNPYRGFTVRSTRPKVGSDLSNVLSAMTPQDLVTISGTLLLWKGLYLPADCLESNLEWELWPAVYHPDIGKRIVSGGHSFAVHFYKISR